MPRRRALTEAQLESLLALPVTEADLLRHWTLSDDDLVAIGRRRRNHNQLGFALQLCALRYPGRLLRPGEVIPEPTLRFVADQLGTAPEALTTYAARFQTRYEQLGVLRKSFGFTDAGRSRRGDLPGQRSDLPQANHEIGVLWRATAWVSRQHIHADAPDRRKVPGERGRRPGAARDEPGHEPDRARRALVRRGRGDQRGGDQSLGYRGRGAEQPDGGHRGGCGAQP